LPLQANATGDIVMTSTSCNRVRVEEIRPFPKAGPRKATGRRRQKTRILTDTPVREERRLIEDKRKQGKSVKRQLNMTKAGDKSQKHKKVRVQPGKRPVLISERPPLLRPPKWLVKKKQMQADNSGSGSDIKDTR